MLLHTILLLFCYKNNSVDYHWDACYFAIYAILLFRGLPGTGTLAILLLCYFAILWFTTGTLAILLYLGDACYFAIYAILLFCDYQKQYHCMGCLKTTEVHKKIDERTLSEHP